MLDSPLPPPSCCLAISLNTSPPKRRRSVRFLPDLTPKRRLGVIGMSSERAFGGKMQASDRWSKMSTEVTTVFETIISPMDPLAPVLLRHFQSPYPTSRASVADHSNQSKTRLEPRCGEGGSVELGCSAMSRRVHAKSNPWTSIALQIRSLR